MRVHVLHRRDHHNQLRHPPSSSEHPLRSLDIPQLHPVDQHGPPGGSRRPLPQLLLPLRQNAASILLHWGSDHNDTERH